MKTKISILTLAVITSTALMFTGCGTDDLSTPTIVLDGDVLNQEGTKSSIRSDQLLAEHSKLLLHPESY
jgi:hypothetical protein